MAAKVQNELTQLTNYLSDFIGMLQPSCRAAVGNHIQHCLSVVTQDILRLEANEKAQQDCRKDVKSEE